MKKITLLLISFLCISYHVSAQIKLTKGAEKMAVTMYFIENYYVDNVDDKKLTEDAIRALLRELDPHSSYISAEEVQEMNEPLEGNFDGIGISFNMVTDTLYVIETISGGPSEKVGILPGDKIIYVSDTLIAGVKMPTKKVMSMLRGPKGSNVTVKVQRRNVKDLIEFVIKRDKIPIYSLDATYMVDSSTGYIKLNKFGATTVDEFKDACKKLKAEGMQNLVLDLQNNGGGYLSAAIELADEFLDKDKLIVYTEGAKQRKSEEKASGKGLFETGKLMILINEYSASASEIVSGAIQDWDRGVIIGRRSFGKGLVQRQVPLPDGSQLRLTTARYYTPTGRCIQKPYENGDIDTYAKDVIERYNKGEMMHADSIHFPDSLKYETLLNKRVVYGGGGIMPDYFVPIDTIGFTNYRRNLNARGIIYKTALKLVDTSRNELLKDYPTGDIFIEKFEVGEDLLNQLKANAEEENLILIPQIKVNDSTESPDSGISVENKPEKTEKLEFSEDEYNRSLPIIKTQIKALIARDLYDNTTYFKVINAIDEVYLDAMKIMRDDKAYHELLKRQISAK